MLSNKVLHKTVQDIKNIAGFDCAVYQFAREMLAGGGKMILRF